MHQYALGSYSKGKANNKKRAEIAMIKNNLREMEKTKKRLEREIIKQTDDLEKMWQDIQLNKSDNPQLKNLQDINNVIKPKYFTVPCTESAAKYMASYNEARAMSDKIDRLKIDKWAKQLDEDMTNLTTPQLNKSNKSTSS